MSQEWDVLEFIERYQYVEVDDQLGEALKSLTQEQLRELTSYLITETVVAPE